MHTTSGDPRLLPCIEPYERAVTGRWQGVPTREGVAGTIGSTCHLSAAMEPGSKRPGPYYPLTEVASRLPACLLRSPGMGRTTGASRSAFVDESRRDDVYALGVVLVADDAANAHRRALGTLLLPGERRFHSGAGAASSPPEGHRSRQRTGWPRRHHPRFDPRRPIGGRRSAGLPGDLAVVPGVANCATVMPREPGRGARSTRTQRDPSMAHSRGQNTVLHPPHGVGGTAALGSGHRGVDRFQAKCPLATRFRILRTCAPVLIVSERLGRPPSGERPSLLPQASAVG